MESAEEILQKSIVASDPHLLKLKEKFSETPDSIILKADVLREGLRYTKELGEIGKWGIPSGAFPSREDIPEGEESSDYVLCVPNQMVLEYYTPQQPVIPPLELLGASPAEGPNENGVLEILHFVQDDMLLRQE